jgi:hypothetical protein
MQCVGSIIVAPLIKKFPTRSVLSVAVLTFGLISAILLIVDAGTGGVMKINTSNNKDHYGSKNKVIPSHLGELTDSASISQLGTPMVYVALFSAVRQLH